MGCLKHPGWSKSSKHNITALWMWAPTTRTNATKQNCLVTWVITNSVFYSKHSLACSPSLFPTRIIRGSLGWIFSAPWINLLSVTGVHSCCPGDLVSWCFTEFDCCNQFYAELHWSFLSALDKKTCFYPYLWNILRTSSKFSKYASKPWNNYEKKNLKNFSRECEISRGFKSASI